MGKISRYERNSFSQSYDPGAIKDAGSAYGAISKASDIASDAISKASDIASDAIFRAEKARIEGERRKQILEKRDSALAKAEQEIKDRNEKNNLAFLLKKASYEALDNFKNKANEIDSNGVDPLKESVIKSSNANIKKIIESSYLKNDDQVRLLAEKSLFDLEANTNELKTKLFANKVIGETENSLNELTDITFKNENYSVYDRFRLESEQLASKFDGVISPEEKEKFLYKHYDKAAYTALSNVINNNPDFKEEDYRLLFNKDSNIIKDLSKESYDRLINQIHLNNKKRNSEEFSTEKLRVSNPMEYYYKKGETSLDPFKLDLNRLDENTLTEYTAEYSRLSSKNKHQFKFFTNQAITAFTGQFNKSSDLEQFASFEKLNQTFNKFDEETSSFLKSRFAREVLKNDAHAVAFSLMGSDPNDNKVSELILKGEKIKQTNPKDMEKKNTKIDLSKYNIGTTAETRFSQAYASLIYSGVESKKAQEMLMGPEIKHNNANVLSFKVSDNGTKRFLTAEDFEQIEFYFFSNNQNFRQIINNDSSETDEILKDGKRLKSFQFIPVDGKGKFMLRYSDGNDSILSHNQILKGENGYIEIDLNKAFNIIKGNK